MRKDSVAELHVDDGSIQRLEINLAKCSKCEAIRLIDAFVVKMKDYVEFHFSPEAPAKGQEEQPNADAGSHQQGHETPQGPN
jgi:hypothetical protein